MTTTQTAAQSDPSDTRADAPPAMRTSAYLVIAALGIIIVVAAFQPWAGVPKVGGSTYDFASEVVGVDAGGWGETAIVAGAVIFALGVLGYFWNPFSDPEALLIAGFSTATMIGAVAKMLDAESLIDPDGEFFDVEATVAPALWVILGASIVALGLAVWILMSRPAEPLAR